MVLNLFFDGVTVKTRNSALVDLIHTETEQTHGTMESSFKLVCVPAAVPKIPSRQLFSSSIPPEAEGTEKKKNDCVITLLK